MKSYNFFLCALALLMGLNSFGQEENQEVFKHHTLSVLLGHSIIFEGVKNGNKKVISLPSWALNYNYSFNEKWTIGLHNDIIIEDFAIEKMKNDNIVERKTPVTSLIVGTYKITPSLGIELGAGVELEKNENFALARIGAEYGIEIPNLNMEVLFGFDYDIIFEAYNGINIGIGVAKRF